MAIAGQRDGGRGKDLVELIGRRDLALRNLSREALPSSGRYGVSSRFSKTAPLRISRGGILIVVLGEVFAGLVKMPLGFLDSFGRAFLCRRCSAGNICLKARSLVAPKKTNASDCCIVISGLPSSPPAFQVPPNSLRIADSSFLANSAPPRAGGSRGRRLPRSGQRSGRPPRSAPVASTRHAPALVTRLVARSCRNARSPASSDAHWTLQQ